MRRVAISVFELWLYRVLLIVCLLNAVVDFVLRTLE